MLDQLKRLSVDNQISLEDLIAAEVLAVGVKDRYEGLNIESPRWLREKISDLRRAITAKVDEIRALEVRDIERELDALKTPQEKRAALQKRLKELRPHVEGVEV